MELSKELKENQNPENCIYSLTANNGKVYIGQTTNYFKCRVRQHLARLKAGKHDNKELQAYYDSNGEESIKADLKEVCPVEELGLREAALITHYKALGLSFNVLPGGTKAKEFEALKARGRVMKWQLLDKEDNIISFSNYYKWCEANGITHGIYNVLTGKQKHFAGYRNISELGKIYSLLDASGNRIEIKNVVKFAEERKLCASTLYKVINKTQYAYAGFTNPDNLKPVTRPVVKLTPEQKQQRIEEGRVKARAYYHENKEERKQYSRDYYAKNSKEVIEKRKDYLKRYRARPECREAKRKYNTEYNKRLKSLKLTSKA